MLTQFVFYGYLGFNSIYIYSFVFLFSYFVYSSLMYFVFNEQSYFNSLSKFVQGIHLFIYVCFIYLFVYSSIYLCNQCACYLCVLIYLVSECSSISTFKSSSRKFWKRTSSIEVQNCKTLRKQKKGGYFKDCKTRQLTQKRRGQVNVLSAESEYTSGVFY